jgi:hypothetical protein
MNVDLSQPVIIRPKPLALGGKPSRLNLRSLIKQIVASGASLTPVQLRDRIVASYPQIKPTSVQPTIYRLVGERKLRYEGDCIARGPDFEKTVPLRDIVQLAPCCKQCDD